MYNYKEAVKSDVKDVLTIDIDNYIAVKEALDQYKNDEIDLDELCSILYDELVCVDSVTGNCSGSYTFNREKAKEYVLQNIELVVEASKEYGYTLDDLYQKGYEQVDVILRCHVLYEAIREVLDELEEEEEEEE